jgi:DNA-binding NtrC family response regulator
LHELVPEPAAPEVLYRPGMTMAEVEKATIAAALNESRGNRRQAAAKLGIGERTLYRKIKEYELV